MCITKFSGSTWSSTTYVKLLRQLSIVRFWIHLVKIMYREYVVLCLNTALIPKQYLWNLNIPFMHVTCMKTLCGKSCFKVLIIISTILLHYGHWKCSKLMGDPKTIAKHIKPNHPFTTIVRKNLQIISSSKNLTIIIVVCSFIGFASHHLE
jgi:hypothetical protein